MDNSYICDDRDVSETVKKIRTMTDEEFEEYLKSLKKDNTDEPAQQ